MQFNATVHHSSVENKMGLILLVYKRDFYRY